MPEHQREKTAQVQREAQEASTFLRCRHAWCVTVGFVTLLLVQGPLVVFVCNLEVDMDARVATTANSKLSAKLSYTGISSQKMEVMYATS